VKTIGFVGISAVIAADTNENGAPILTDTSLRSIIKTRDQNYKRFVQEVDRKEKVFNWDKTKQEAQDNPFDGISQGYRDRSDRSLSKLTKAREDHFRWRSRAGKKLTKTCTNTKALGMVYYPYTSSGRSQVDYRCRKMQRSLSKKTHNQMSLIHRLQQDYQSSQRRASEIEQAEMMGYRKAMQDGDYFFNGHGYSDDLYSPFLDNYQDFERRGHSMGMGAGPGSAPDHSPFLNSFGRPPGTPPGSPLFQYDSRLHLLNSSSFDNPFTYPRGYQSPMPTMFGPPPSMALPPTFASPPARRPSRGLTGWYD
ncbi:MAG: hypothetical protein OXB88_11045, partial [Bacteriovoracales bacterium]|nr:hypothetical protein [Bacteriovoracales bacterium]